MDTMKPFESYTIGDLKKLTEQFVNISNNTNLLKVHPRAEVEDQSTSAEDIIKEMEK